MIALYAVGWRAAVDALDDDAGAVLAEGDLALVAGSAPEATSRDDALAFGRAVERIAATVDVLPFRYGTTVADKDEARKLLREHASAWTARLVQVEGCAEMAIRAVPPTADTERATSGAEHLGRLVSRNRRLEGTEAEIVDVLAGRCRVVRRLPGHDELRLSCLVERHQVELVRLVIEEWASTRTDLRVTVTGPWAPYSFVADGEEAG